ncbi:MAG: 50S ribosomal protein L17 [Elusimicrobia bacterium]|nr:50S ribosomal protein L17 [Elusimicrobiota bacterium]
MIKNLGGRKLSKTGSHRRRMLANMATSLLLQEKVRTTVPKAKELRGITDRIIVLARQGNQREVRRILRDKTVTQKLFEVLVPRYKDRPAGFTRLYRLGRRQGDGAEMSLVQLIT